MALSQIQQDAQSQGDSANTAEGATETLGGTAHYEAGPDKDTSYLVDNATGKILRVIKAPDVSLGSAIKTVAPVVLNMFAPGLGTTIGSSLGAGTTMAPIVGGAVLGGGTAALTGQDVLRGAFMGGLSGAAQISVGDTGYTIGDLTKATNVIKAANNGDILGALSGAARISGMSMDIPIGDTGYTLSDITKNAALGKALMSGDPKAVIGAITKFAGIVQANSTNTPTEAQFNAQNQDFLNSLAPYESTDPNVLLDLAVGNQQKSAQADQSAIDSRTQDIIRQLQDAGMTPDEVAATDWAALYATPTTDPATGQTIVGGDPSQFANQNLNIGQEQLDSYNQNLQKIIDGGGFASQWQTSSGDRIMISDDGSGIGINQDGDSYALTQDQVTQMVKNGQLNTADSGYVAATGGTGNTPGGSGTKTTTTSTTKTTPTTTQTTTTTPTATTPAALAGVSWYGINPADLVKADKNDVAHIKSFKELFGHELYGDEQVPASSAQDHNVSRDDILQALEDTQNYASGGDIHALLQLLRS